MREAIHASPNFNIDITVFSDFVGKFVMAYDIIRKIAELESHILEAGHQGAKVEVLYVNGHELGKRG